MKAQKFLRLAHRWISIAAAPVLIVMIGAGVLLMLKKDVDWIQPPSQRGAEIVAAPDTRLDALFEAARAVPEAGIESWDDLDRFDINPGRGIAKLISTSRWEVQVDLQSLEVLSVAYRRSDLIEQIHDGSFFAEWVKLYVFLPVGLGLFLLWVSGLYLFILPYAKKALTRRRRSRARGEADGQAQGSAAE